MTDEYRSGRIKHRSSVRAGTTVPQPMLEGGDRDSWRLRTTTIDQDPKCSDGNVMERLSDRLRRIAAKVCPYNGGNKWAHCPPISEA
ncbi:hypothetical protein QR680_010570 [Steinernema hermaphroditum]|uniref:Uncharacterized protein n=1 Tax=Steinernema hermaphroditum TaxID=289476 RepID=A0AA39IQW8_9BILA|nr:hypothetical protein QR680_010570 [Steinernema hermaphroditum]